MTNQRPLLSSFILYLQLPILIMVLFISSLSSQAQPGRLERYEESAKSFFQRWTINVNGNVEHMFNTDIDGGGKFNITRLGFNHDATFDASERLNVTFSSSYNFYNFDFSGSQGLAGLRPWRNIGISVNGMRVNYAVNRNWGVFVSPLITHAAEFGAPFWDSLTVGGLAGVSYRTGPNFTIGIGGFVGSRLEQSVIGYPIGFIDWQITERLHLSSLASGARNDFGPKAELTYELESGFKVAASVGYEFNRFRLERDGNFPKGVGDFKALPVIGRVSYDVNKYLTINGYTGWLFLGSLEVENSRGKRIRKENYDPAPFVGGSLTLRL